MPCYHPSAVKVRRKSLFVDRMQSYRQVVPCGSCIGCRSEQSRQWAVRMMHESRMHFPNEFVTLTIDDEHLNENSELSPRDLSGFIKNLRKTQQGRISFFGCGEYGETTGRPHYHALLFGVEFLDRNLGFDSNRPSVWRSQALDDLWGRGICEGGSVTMASASYVSGYIRKKVKAQSFARANPLTGELLQPEFARMSLRPAIGKRWIKRWWRDVYPRDYVVVDGVQAKPPRYYDKWMDKYQPELMEQVRQNRWDDMEERPSTYKERAAEEIHEARVNLFNGRAGV